MVRRSLPLVFALFLLSCSADSRYDFGALDEAIEAFRADNALEGATVIVVHRDHGVVHRRAFGSFRLDRISLLASASKILSVGVLMRLADQGLLDIDAPISDYLADWGEHKTDITVAQLLSNSSGMPGLIDDPTYAPYLCQFLHVSSLSACARAIYQVDDEADRIPPDTEFRYGGGQWQLAGGIAEVVSGQTWETLVHETYVDPCRLDVLGYTNQFANAFTMGGGVEAGFSYPTFFDGDLDDLPNTRNPNIEGGGYTTVGDYGKILLMHLRGGQCSDDRVLSAESVARMQEDRIAVYGEVGLDPSLSGYGLGWWVDRENPGFVADPGAYGAMPWLDTARGYGIMVLLEADGVLGGNLRFILTPILEEIFDGEDS